MAKKKSKTQKQKRNIKRKNAKELQKTMMLKALNEESSNLDIEKQAVEKSNTKASEESSKPNKEKQLVEKNKVKYNVVLNSKNNIKKDNKNAKKITNTPDKTKQLVDKNKVKYNVLLTSKPKKENKNKEPKKLKNELNLNSNKSPIKIHPFNFICTKITKNTKKKDIKDKKRDIPNKKGILYPITLLKNNLHIIFNSLIIITFIIFLIGLIRINAFEKNTIIYISSLTIFLIIIAISYNKYISGKIFTILLCLAMGAGIYKMQYTYDFINTLNTAFYESKTYYVVAFDNNSNRNIYTLNNKKIGLMSENSINVERLLNTKLDDIKYIEYENINNLFSDFYSQQFRALIVNENQYKYLKNNIEENSKPVKILYEFKANAKK